MVSIEHGDLIEQRRGGVDVLRVLVRNLAMHEQSGAVCIRSAVENTEQQGWLLFRLGQPVMAFHNGATDHVGLEALLAIEQDALEVDNHVLLYELTMNSLRSTMRQHPESVLHLEHQDTVHAEGSWWSSVRLPSSSWRRAARLEDIEQLALSTEERRRTSPAASPRLELEPGRIYLMDSPDPHPMIHLAVELGERGMPLLGLFGLPHASTDITRRLPAPQSYALLSPHGNYEVLADRAAMDAVVNAFQWGNERSVLALDGLDRLGNALGEDGMLDAFRSICDGVRFNDHVALVTTDLEMFETAVQRRLLAEVTLVRSSDVQAWIDDPDGLWDHPLLLAPDEEEEQWLEAQIQHQGAVVGATLSMDAAVEGGSHEPDAEERAEATQALADVVEAWPSPPANEVVETVEADSVVIGSSPWRPPSEPPFVEGRFVSESPRAEPVERFEPPTSTPKKARRRTRVTTPNESVPVMRSAQRLPKRKSTPALPPVKAGLTPTRSSAVVERAPPLPDWPRKTSVPQAYRKENLDVFSDKQTRAVQRQTPIPNHPLTSALKDNVVSSPDLESVDFPTDRVAKTVILPSSEESRPLTNSLRPVEADSKPSREASTKSQANLNMDDVYRRWSTFEDHDGMDSTALYDEYGEALERYEGGDQ